MYVHVPMVSPPPELLVQQTMPTFARPVMVDTTKLVTPAINVDLLAQQVNTKLQHAQHHPIDSAQRVKRADQKLIQMVGVVVAPIKFVQHA